MTDQAIARLIDQVQRIVDESGRPEGFNATKWVKRWICEPLPALGGRTPASCLDTLELSDLKAKNKGAMSSLI